MTDAKYAKTQKYKSKTKEYNNREDVKSRKSAWAKAHRPILTDKQKEDARRRASIWAKEHPERANDRSRKWAKAHPEYGVMKSHKRRAMLSGSGVYKVSEWRALKKFYDFTCLDCGRREPEIKLTVDHVVPVSKGGANTIDNIQPLCLSCNDKKGIKVIDFR